MTGIKRNVYGQTGNFNFSVDLSVSDYSKITNFGFSGNNEVLNFMFSNGKIYDPNNNFCGSYVTNSFSNISGHVGSGSYDYFVDNIITAIERQKSSGILDYFYLYTDTGNNVNFNLFIEGNQPSYSIVDNLVFDPNQLLTGIIINNDSGNNIPIRLFSGSTTNGSFQLQSIQTGEFIDSGIFVFQPSGIGEGETVTLPITLNTNFGNISFSINATSSTSLQTSRTTLVFADSAFSDIISSNQTGLQTDSSNLGLITISGNNTIDTPVIQCYLTYHSGNTGEYFTDIIGTGTGSAIISGNVIGSGQISGQVIDNGSGYGGLLNTFATGEITGQFTGFIYATGLTLSGISLDISGRGTGAVPFNEVGTGFGSGLASGFVTKVGSLTGSLSNVIGTGLWNIDGTLETGIIPTGIFIVPNYVASGFVIQSNNIIASGTGTGALTLPIELTGTAFGNVSGFINGSGLLTGGFYTGTASGFPSGIIIQPTLYTQAGSGNIFKFKSATGNFDYLFSYNNATGYMTGRFASGVAGSGLVTGASSNFIIESGIIDVSNIAAMTGSANDGLVIMRDTGILTASLTQYATGDFSFPFRVNVTGGVFNDEYTGIGHSDISGFFDVTIENGSGYYDLRTPITGVPTRSLFRWRLVPQLSSEDQSGLVEGSVGETFNFPYEAFDRNNFNYFETATGTGYLSIFLGTGSGQVVDAYSFTSSNNSNSNPNQWKFQASSDGNSWSTLHSVNNLKFTESFQTKSYVFDNTTSYEYYRLLFDQPLVPGITLRVAEWNLSGVREMGGFNGYGLIPSMISNSTPSGQASANDSNFGNNPAYLAFDNNNNTNWIGNISSQVTRNNFLLCDSEKGDLNDLNVQFNGTIESIDGDDDRIYVGGNFTNVNSGVFERFAILDMSSGHYPLQVNFQVNNTVNKVKASGDNIFVGGSFTNVSGETRNRIFSTTKNGLLRSWNPNVNGPVHDIATYNDQIYIVGDFTQVSGIPKTGIARINEDGSLDTSFESNYNNTSDNIRNFVVNDTGLFVVGDFNYVTENRVDYGASFFVSGLNIFDPGFKPDFSNTVRASLRESGKFYCGGSFTNVSGNSRSRLVIFDEDGNFDSFNQNFNGEVLSLALSGNTLYVGGDFTTVNGISRNRVAAFNITGTSHTGELLAWNPNANSSVENIIIDETDGSIWLGGEFTTIDGVSNAYLAHINATDGSNLGFNANINGDVHALFVTGDNIYAGGDFTNVQFQTTNRIVRLNKSGLIDTSFTGKSNSTVFVIEPFQDKLLVGGSFSVFNDQDQDRGTIINTGDGSLAINDNIEFDNTVFTIKQFENNIYWGGSFTAFSGQVICQRLVKSNTSGIIDTSWSPYCDSTIYDMEFDNNRIYTFGSFSDAGTARAKAAAFAHDGQLLPWHPRLSNDAYVITEYDNVFFIGGNFDHVNNFNTDIAKVDKNTGIHQDNFYAITNSVIFDILSGNNELIIGGSFTQYNGINYRYISKVDTNTGQLKVFTPKPTDDINSIYSGNSGIYLVGDFTQAGGEWWVKYDFGSGIGRNNIYKQCNTTFGNGQPLIWEFQGSNDGQNWTGFYENNFTDYGLSPAIHPLNQQSGYDQVRLFVRASEDNTFVSIESWQIIMSGAEIFSGTLDDIYLGSGIYSQTSTGIGFGLGTGCSGFLEITGNITGQKNVNVTGLDGVELVTGFTGVPLENFVLEVNQITGASVGTGLINYNIPQFGDSIFIYDTTLRFVFDFNNIDELITAISGITEYDPNTLLFDQPVFSVDKVDSNRLLLTPRFFSGTQSNELNVPMSVSSSNLGNMSVIPFNGGQDLRLTGNFPMDKIGIFSKPPSFEQPVTGTGFFTESHTGGFRQNTFVNTTGWVSGSGLIPVVNSGNVSGDLGFILLTNLSDTGTPASAVGYSGQSITPFGVYTNNAYSIQLTGTGYFEQTGSGTLTGLMPNINIDLRTVFTTGVTISGIIEDGSGIYFIDNLLISGNPITGLTTLGPTGYGQFLIASTPHTGLITATLTGTGNFSTGITGEFTGVIPNVLDYIKTFTGSWNFYTGNPDNLVDFKINNWFNQTGFNDPNSPILNLPSGFDIQIEYLVTKDFDNMVSLLTITGSNTGIRRFVTGQRIL